MTIQKCEKIKTYMKKQNKTKKKYNSSLIAPIQFTKPMQIELSQLLQMMFSVKVQSNALEKIQSNQSLYYEIANYVGNHPKNM